MADYTSIDRPYDGVGNRTPGGTSPVLNEISNLFNQPAEASSYTDPTATGTSTTADANYTGVQTTQTVAGAVETQQVNTNQSLANLWISTFIRSTNWKPTARGFNIDGLTGNAEFNDVTVRGTIYATAGSIGGWTINATTISSAGLILNSTGSIGTSNFVSGQTGWQISSTGTAEFNNAIFRGEIRASVLTKDEVHATGGSLLVLSASILLNDFTSVTTPTTSTLDLKDPPSGHTQLFAVNDIVRIKDGSGLDNWLKVTAASDQTTFWRYTVQKQSGTNGTMRAGTAVVNYKQATDGFVLLTSDATNSPYVDIGLSGATPWAGTTGKARIGNLGGITDPTFGALTGFGIWTDSGYFTGSINAAAGLIGGWTIGAHALTSGSGATTVGLDNTVTAADDVRIYAGSATPASAPFRVTEAGNVVVNSFERNDFHWFTMFESINGFAKAGTPILNQDSVTLNTTNVLGNECELQKVASYSNYFTWDKRRKIKFGFNMSTFTNQDINMMSGVGQYGTTAQRIGFRVVGNQLYSVTCNGVTETTTSIQVVGTGTTYELEARLTPGVNVLFYVGGNLVATHTTNLPSGTANANWMLDFAVRTGENVIKTFLFTYFDFWQAA